MLLWWSNQIEERKGIRICSTTWHWVNATPFSSHSKLDELDCLMSSAFFDEALFWIHRLDWALAIRHKWTEIHTIRAKEAFGTRLRSKNPCSRTVRFTTRDNARWTAVDYVKSAFRSIIGGEFVTSQTKVQAELILSMTRSANVNRARSWSQNKMTSINRLIPVTFTMCESLKSWKSDTSHIYVIVKTSNKNHRRLAPKLSFSVNESQMNIASIQMTYLWMLCFQAHNSKMHFVIDFWALIGFKGSR